jgi:hypothetical protein
VYESSVRAERYDPGSGSWVQDGTVDSSTDTVTFAPTGPGVFGRANGDPAARTACDFDTSGRVDFLDVVTLLFELS